jgi:predicted ribosomally synthesized peptide with nif11-like leader
MSIQTALAFRDKIKVTPELQARIRQAAETPPVNFVKLATEYGFEFTEAEWYQALNPNEKSVLGSFDLDKISGSEGKLSGTE